eukprot:Awhi_evm1s1350
MKLSVPSSYILWLLTLGFNTVHSENTFYYTPAEFDVQEAVYIGWPRYKYISTLNSAEVVLNMIEGLCSTESVIIQVPADLFDDAKQAIEKAGLFNLCEKKLSFDQNDRDDFWIRDMGPVFTKTFDDTHCNKDETFCEPNKTTGVDFNFDFWSSPTLAGAELLRLEESLDDKIYKGLNVGVTYTHLIGEGGNREFDGRGTLLMNKNVERLRNEKLTWTLEESVEEYKRVFGVSSIIWVDGVPSNDHLADQPVSLIINDENTIAFNWGTGGHI